jgi:AraC-like DNA-binding protein
MTAPAPPADDAKPAGARRKDAAADIKTYTMVERSERLDFEIRDRGARHPVEHPHRHEFFQIFANQTGAAMHMIGGRRFEYGARSLVFVLPYRVHQMVHPPEATYCVMNFASNFLRHDFSLTSLQMEEASINEYPELTPFIYQGFVHFAFDEAGFAHIQSLLDRLHRLHAERTLGTPLRIRAGVLELIGFATERYADQLRTLAEGRVYLQRRTDALRRALKFIDENLQREISLNDVAEGVFLSPNYLSQMLKKQTGLAFVEWLTGRRMDRARELLAHTPDRVCTIADAVGFRDQAYFTRRFRQRFGVSPSGYRQTLQSSA